MSGDVHVVEIWLQRHAGLEAHSLGAGTVARAARDRMEEIGCAEVADYTARLAADPGERQELIDRVVVPETWFFREPAALTGLARHVVETWGPAHPGAVFRALCVPCSTGEEPYSLAMALRQAGWPAERLRIDAVDISRANLARAAAGTYGKNSFRGADLAFRAAVMTPAPDGRWRVNDAVRAGVRFEAGNLLDAEFAAGRGRYDAVLCRNLLIYFSRETQVRAAGILESLLAPGAWLAVGAAEAVLMLEQGFATVPVRGAFLLHKPEPAAGRPEATGRLQGSGSEASTVRVARPAKSAARPAARAMARPEDTGPTLADVRALADAGRLREATAAGERLLARDGGPAELFFLLAVVAEAAGDTARAEACLRKTLYLESGHAEAMVHLALLTEKQGDRRGAQALRARAQRALERGAA